MSRPLRIEYPGAWYHLMNRGRRIDFASQGEPEEIERFYSLKNLPSVLAGDSCKEWVKEKFNHLRFVYKIPESRRLSPSPEDIIALVRDHFKGRKREVAISIRGTENLPRDITIYLVRHHSRDTPASVSASV
ncbi:MAG: hypothetical protein GQ559_01780 [Desulfobulbaceae bacterium]|nr:hypothetical protein [Desulfobulbaceae bacterium]